jgi:hypothetical protein
MKLRCFFISLLCLLFVSGCAFAADKVKKEDPVRANQIVDPCETIKSEYRKLLKAYEDRTTQYYQEKQARLRAESEGFKGQIAEESKEIQNFRKVLQADQK